MRFPIRPCNSEDPFGHRIDTVDNSTEPACDDARPSLSRGPSRLTRSAIATSSPITASRRGSLGYPFGQPPVPERAIVTESRVAGLNIE